MYSLSHRRSDAFGTPSDSLEFCDVCTKYMSSGGFMVTQVVRL